MANESKKDFNVMMNNNKDMPKIQIVEDEKIIKKYGGTKMFFAPPIYYDELMRTTPVSTGGLKESLIKTPIRSHLRYGYTIQYDGYNEKGVPYQYIANSLNKGSNGQIATRHLDRARKKLKNIDFKIAERWKSKIGGK